METQFDSQTHSDLPIIQQSALLETLSQSLQHIDKSIVECMLYQGKTTLTRDALLDELASHRRGLFSVELQI
jgi:hypothetical protein